MDDNILLQGPRDPGDRQLGWCETAETTQGPELIWWWEICRIAAEGGWDPADVWAEDCRMEQARREFRRRYGRPWTIPEMLGWIAADSGDSVRSVVTAWVLMEAAEGN